METETGSGQIGKAMSFYADKAPIGTVIQLGRNTPEERIAKSEFHKYMFQYFENLVSGQTGWGVDFHGWLEIVKGWKHHGSGKFERIQSMEEILDSENKDDKLDRMLEALKEIAKRGANPITGYGYGKDKPWARLADDIWRIAGDALGEQA